MKPIKSKPKPTSHTKPSAQQASAKPASAELAKKPVGRTK